MSAPYLGDFPADQAIYFMYNTSDSDGASITRSADGAISVYKDNSDGSSYDQTQVTTGITEDEDVDGLTGVHSVCIATTDGWYETGHDYAVVLSASTIDAQTVNAVIATFSIENRPVDMTRISGDQIAADNLELQYDTTGLTGDTFPATQSQLGQIALTGAAVSTPAKDSPNGFAITHGENEANNEDSTHAADGTYHDIEAVNDGGTEKIDVYYEFTVGGDGIPTAVTWEGYLNKGGGAGKNITVQAYNWGTTSWDQIGSISSGVTDSIETFAMFTSHVGTGANLGTVRIRFLTGSVAFSATTMLKTDQIYCSYAIVARSVGYANGRIWVDTNAANTNTETYVDGVADNPVSTWAAALTIAGNLGIDRFHLAPASSIVLSGNSDSYDILGYGATVDLNGQSVSGALIEGVTINGNDDGSNALALRLRNCKLTTNTLGKARFNQCPFAGDLTLAEATTYIMEACLSAIAGTSTPSLDFGVAVGNTNVNFRHYSGGIEIENMGKTGTDTMSLEGDGQLVINANCDPSNSPVIAIRGNFTITDNVVGGFVAGGGTISDDARYDTGQIASELETYDSPTKAEMDAAHALLATVAKQDVIDGIVDNILVDTDVTIPALIAALNDLSSADVTTELTTYDVPTKAEMDAAHALLATLAICSEARLSELDAANIPTDIAAIPTTAMRGTDNAALATVATEARLAELDAANIPAVADAIKVITDLTGKWLNNKMSFTGTSMILYDDDGVTPLKTWTLSEGNLTVDGPYNRSAAS